MARFAPTSLRSRQRAFADEAPGLAPWWAGKGSGPLTRRPFRCDADPEAAAIDAPLRITIDGQLFEEVRTLFAAAIPGEQTDD